MIHLKKFKTNDEFESEKSELLKPWVVSIADSSKPHYSSEEGDEPEPIGPKNNEIWYTSSDGNVVTPYSDTAFGGATILSNEYSDGQGVITFDCDLVEIGQSAFKNCSGLTSVNIPNSITLIGAYAFQNCKSLTSVVIPDSVTSIGIWAFNGCSNIQNIYITDLTALFNITGLNNLMNYGTINKHLFLNGEEVFDLVIPDSVTTIGNSAFWGCSSLTSVNIPDSVTTIGDFAFQHCSNIQNIYITDLTAWFNITGLTYLMGVSTNKHLFLNGEEVFDLVIPDSVTTIGNSAFYGCSSLTSVNIPNSITLIGANAFQNCRSLTSVVIPDSVTSIGIWAFRLVPHIEYHGTATGSPWGAISIN